MKRCLAVLCLIYAVRMSELINPDLSEDPSECGMNDETFYNHTPFSYIIEEPDLCAGDVFMLNYVQSSSEHFERRALIRETWGSLRYANAEPVKLLFVIGIPKSKEIQMRLEDESDHYRDIVQADFFDTYRNLTLKHIVALHWIDTFCSQAKFISKTDDDTFIDIFTLAEYSKEFLNEDDKFILGQIFSNETPIRRNGFKWTVSKDMYQPDKYPPFIKGFAYVMSQAAIKPLLLCSFYQKFLFIDDVFITGLVALKAKVRLENFEHKYGFTYLRSENITENMLANIFFVGRNSVSPKQWRILWRHTLNQVL